MTDSGMSRETDDSSERFYYSSTDSEKSETEQHHQPRDRRTPQKSTRPTPGNDVSTKTKITAKPYPGNNVDSQSRQRFKESSAEKKKETRGESRYAKMQLDVNRFKSARNLYKQKRQKSQNALS